TRARAGVTGHCVSRSVPGNVTAAAGSRARLLTAADLPDLRDRAGVTTTGFGTVTCVAAGRLRRRTGLTTRRHTPARVATGRLRNRTGPTPRRHTLACVATGRLRRRAGAVPRRPSVLVGAGVGGDSGGVRVAGGRSGAGRRGVDRVGGTRIFGAHGP